MKHSWFFYPITFIFFTCFCYLLLWIYQPIVQSKNKISLASPLPAYFDMTKNDAVTQLDLWIPSEKSQDIGLPKPSITAPVGLGYDIITDQFTYQKNIKLKRPMASLTKLMTAIVSLEHQRIDDKYRVDQSDLVGEDSMGLDSGEILSLKELLYGLDLHSANDAAETLASNSPYGRNGFIEEMNKKAQTLGLLNSHFTNPSGLEGDGNQYTTAYDLLVMTHYLLINFPVFDDVTATVSFDIPQTATHKEYYLENETNLVATYPGVKGVKDGYTPEAGLCLVTYLEYGGHKIIAIVLNSQNRRADMIQILDYSLKTLGVKPPSHL